MESIYLYSKLSELPEKLKKEVADFIDFLVSKSNKPGNKKKPQFGSGKGMFIIEPGFDKPLEDFNEYMH